MLPPDTCRKQKKFFSPPGNGSGTTPAEFFLFCNQGKNILAVRGDTFQQSGSYIVLQSEKSGRECVLFT